jgi:hypothetical protein
MISIQKITLEELEVFLNSKLYKEFDNKPISEARVASYLNNPRANNKDIVLYLVFLEKKLVSYRTILSDTLFVKDKEVPFGWLSGNWVDEKHRRKGFSTLLFKEVKKDWNSKLIYTNYAEASKLVYDKTQDFKLLKELKGRKYYMRFCLADILPKKKEVFKITRFIWRFMDVFLNIFLDILKILKKNIQKNIYIVKENEELSDSILEFIKNKSSENLFRRAAVELNWIQTYPWILTNEATKNSSKKYNFSSYSKEFESIRYTLYDQVKCMFGCVLITVRDGHLKIPYVYYKKETIKEIALFIASKCKEKNVKTVVIYQKELEEELNKLLFFVGKKEFTQKYFIMKTFEKVIKIKEFQIQSGDGDVVFT